MAFPAVPRVLIAELFLNGGWVDVTDDVYQRDDVTISRGRANEAARSQPSSCSLTIDNASGDYSTRNPLGAYYGRIGRNTPLRLALRSTYDTFGRTVSEGWGSDDLGNAWSFFSLGGTISATDRSVSGGVGVHSVPAASAYRATYLAGVVHRDVDVAVTVSMAISNVTGGDVEPANIMVRGQSTSSYYMARVVITSAEVVTVSVHHSTAGQLVAPVTVSGLTFGAGVSLRVRVQAEGNTVRVKVWNAAGSEPYDWHVSARDTRITTAGWVGIRSGVASGNTNTKPVTFSYDSLVVSVPRYAGEVSEWPVKSDVSNTNRYVPIEAAGMLRRLGQGDPLRSVIRRGVLSIDPVAYWPCEESSGATVIASGLSGGSPMLVNPEPPRFGANTDFACSGDLPAFSNTWWHGAVPTYDTSSGQVQVRMLLSVPDGGGFDGEKIVRVSTTGGTTGFWDVLYGAGGTLTVTIFDPNGAALYSSGAVTYELDGRPVRLSLEMIQDGADIDWTLGTIGIDGDAGVVTGTLAGRTFGRIEWINIGGDGFFTDVAIGHITVQNEVTSIFELDDELAAYVGETAGARLVRLSEENAIPLAIVGDPADTVAMGAQRVDTLTNLIEECVDADFGVLHESRGTIGLVYRTRSSAYHQTPTVELDLSAGQISPPWEPVDDDQLTRNDITVKRENGGESRATLGTGRMSILDPADGGAGRYSSTMTVNVEDDVQLPDIAGWRLNLGTVDEPRYPKIHVNLASAEVASLVASLLDLDVLDRLVVTGASSTGMYDDISQIVQGYTETLATAYGHRLALTCTPESPYRVAVLDNDAYKLDSEATFLAEDLHITETGVTVTITNGPLWTTDAGQMPISIMVGGEEMTVTAISGTSSPQTMTVTRSVNGVVKTHSTGAQVRLARPAVLGL